MCWHLIDLDKRAYNVGDTIYEFDTIDKMFKFIDDLKILNFQCWYGVAK